jgi:hypothetical protein
MADKIDAKAGMKGQVLCSFDGQLLELFGTGPSGSVRIMAAQSRLKPKKKPEKDGGQTIYIIGPGMTGRQELYFAPDEVANMQKLVDALKAAGAQPM